MKSIRMEPTELNEDWAALAREYGLDPAVIERKAKFTYMSRYKELPNGNFPPVWENASQEVRNWMRRQITVTLIA